MVIQEKPLKHAFLFIFSVLTPPLNCFSFFGFDFPSRKTKIIPKTIWLFFICKVSTLFSFEWRLCLCLERNKAFVIEGKDSTFKHLMLASWWFHYWLLLSSLWAKNQTPPQLYKAALLDLFAIKFKSSFFPMTRLLAWDDFLLVPWRHLQTLY